MQSSSPSTLSIRPAPARRHRALQSGRSGGSNRAARLALAPCVALLWAAAQPAAQSQRTVTLHSSPTPSNIAPHGAQGAGFIQCTRLLDSITGEAAGDQFGWVSSAIPDVDGDGVMEILTSAPFHSTNRVGVGRIYLYSGKTGNELFQASGFLANENLGYAVDAAGDVDGDGVEDFIAGGPAAPTRKGVARIRSGADGTQIWLMSPGAVGDRLGSSVAGVGDVNGDGFDDVALGAPADNTAGAGAGRVYIVSGIDGSTILWSINGEAAGDQFGSGMGALGDVTGDGKLELAVGAMNGGAGNRGKVYVYNLQTQSLVFARQPDTSGVNYGQFFVYAVGDVNNDTWPDLYVSDFADGGGRGKAYIYNGLTGGLLWKFQGQAGDGFGIGRGAGDFDGDGYDDILLASWVNSSGANRAGKAEIFSGRTGAILRRMTSTTANETLGFDAHGIGDVDGDGQPDYVLTAAGNANSRGKIYVVAGGREFEQFGVGLAGTGGVVPKLSFSGCSELGGTFTLDVADTVGAAHGCLIIGDTLLDKPFFGGTRYTNMNLFTFAHRADGVVGATGAGTASFTFTLPNDPALAGQTFYVQSAYLDSAAPQKISLTDAVRFNVF